MHFSSPRKSARQLLLFPEMAADVAANAANRVEELNPTNDVQQPAASEPPTPNQVFRQRWLFPECAPDADADTN